MRVPSFFRALAVVLLPLVLGSCLGIGGGAAGDGGVSPAAVSALNGGLIAQNTRMAELPDGVRTYALSAEYQALQFAPAGERVTWTSEGYSGEVVPTQVYRVGTSDCRGYTHTVAHEGAVVSTHGAACRTDRGFWQPVA